MTLASLYWVSLMTKPWRSSCFLRQLTLPIFWGFTIDSTRVSTWPFSYQLSPFSFSFPASLPCSSTKHMVYHYAIRNSCSPTLGKAVWCSLQTPGKYPISEVRDPRPPGCTASPWMSTPPFITHSSGAPWCPWPSLLQAWRKRRAQNCPWDRFWKRVYGNMWGGGACVCV